MSQVPARDRTGFTLIELVAVIVVLAVLVGIALPKFLDLQDEARVADCKGCLGGIRQGMASFYLDKALSGSAAYPTYGEIDSRGVYMQEDLPDNPYNDMNTIRDLAKGDADIRWTDGTTGWCYYVNNALNPPEAVFWPNSNDVGENTF